MILEKAGKAFFNPFFGGVFVGNFFLAEKF
jgi:hypothetical protein